MIRKISGSLSYNAPAASASMMVLQDHSIVSSTSKDLSVETDIERQGQRAIDRDIDNLWLVTG